MGWECNSWRLIPAGTGRMTTEYEKVAYQRDKEIIDQKESESIENLE